MAILFVLGGFIALIGGVMLIRKFGARATRTGIGSFTLVPLSGIAYLAGCFLIPLGAVFLAIGIGILSGFLY